MKSISLFKFYYLALSPLPNQVKDNEHGEVNVKSSLLLENVTIPDPHIHLAFGWVTSSKHGDATH